MRDTIREAIMNVVPAFGDRVFQPLVASATTQKPFVVVKFGDESSSGNIRDSYSRDIEVWPYFSLTNYDNLDTVNESIIEALTKNDLVTSNGYVFRLTCENVAADGFYDEEYEAVTKRIIFTQPFLRAGGA